MMSKALILQQQARRILGNHSVKTYLIGRSYKTQSAVKTKLEQWSKQGDHVKPSYVRGMIKDFQDSKKFSNALEASEWMFDQRVFNKFPEDYASRLQLVETVLGLEEAEKFFKSIPENMRDYTVYDNLLRCYTKSEKTIDKAEATFEKMRDLGFLFKPSPYNSMISLYNQLKKQDLVKKLQLELVENNVENNVENEKKKNNIDVKDEECRRMITSLLRQDDIEGAEKVYEEWKSSGTPIRNMRMPNLLISWYRAKGNESKVEELVKSARKGIFLSYFLLVLIIWIVIWGFIKVASSLKKGLIKEEDKTANHESNPTKSDDKIDPMFILFIIFFLNNPFLFCILLWMLLSDK